MFEQILTFPFYKFVTLVLSIYFVYINILIYIYTCTHLYILGHYFFIFWFTDQPPLYIEKKKQQKNKMAFENKNLCLINTNAPELTVVNNLTLESEVANLYGRP
jgi:hypothetical protein